MLAPAGRRPVGHTAVVPGQRKVRVSGNDRGTADGHDSRSLEVNGAQGGVPAEVGLLPAVAREVGVETAVDAESQQPELGFGSIDRSSLNWATPTTIRPLRCTATLDPDFRAADAGKDLGHVLAVGKDTTGRAVRW